MIVSVAVSYVISAALAWSVTTVPLSMRRWAAPTKRTRLAALSYSMRVGVALAVFVLAVALLAERGGMCRRAEGIAQALAVGILAHLDAVGVDLQRALRDDDVADEDGAVLLQVDHIRVGAGAG